MLKNSIHDPACEFDAITNLWPSDLTSRKPQFCDGPPRDVASDSLQTWVCGSDLISVPSGLNIFTPSGANTHIAFVTSACS